MRTLQFWILLLGSSAVSILFIKQIFLSRDINQEQRLLAESQAVIANGPGYENAWKQLALHIYQASRQDPTLAEVLKKENVDVRSAPPAGAGPGPVPPPSVPSPASTKTPVAPLHPATP